MRAEIRRRSDMSSDSRRIEARARCKSLLLLLIMFWPTLLYLEERTTSALANAGSVTELEGVAKLTRQRKELDAVLRMAVLLRDRLRTMSHSHLTVTLNGGSKLILAESSTMLIDETGDDPSSKAAVSLLLGHLRALVRPIGKSSRNFEVHTPNAVIGVRGTEFETAYISGKPCPGFPSCLRYTEVDVYEGFVEVRNPLNPAAAPVVVRHGYSTTVPCELAPSSAAPIGMNELGTPGYR
jgi:ferric-dicitrate binding protein FerR (iron transport regulator)